jgi:MFS superfamily sulfate permease-like transporter
MLAVIGLIIIATQSHVMLGVTPEPGSLFSTIVQIPHSLLNLNTEIALISFLGLLILIIWPLIGSKIPAPVIVVLVGMLFAWHFNLDQDAAVSGSKFLVTISDTTSRRTTKESLRSSNMLMPGLSLKTVFVLSPNPPKGGRWHHVAWQS